MAFAIKPKSKVLFTGDSITDAGRRDNHYPLGNGYVRMIHDLILARYPNHDLSVSNTGISGHTVRDLQNRWTDDVIRHQPDWLSIMIGINDVHRWFNKVAGQSVSAEEYADIYPRILDRVKRETKARLVIIEPFYMSIDSDPSSPRSTIQRELAAYRKTAERMAKQFKAPYVRFHAMFQQQLRKHPADRFCPEPVHPNATGHLLMAHEWLKTMGW
jgi:acyl-CoA thioesterase-1